MKHFIAFSFVVVTLAGCVCIQLLPSPESFFVCGFIFVFVVAVCVRKVHDKNLRREWLKEKILPGDARFDDFFWSLSIHNQNWYMDEVLKENGVRTLLSMYEERATQLWNDKNCPLLQKMDEAQILIERMRTLSYMIEFNYHYVRN